MLFQDIGTYAYLTNGSVPVSGVDDAADLQDSLVSLNKVLCTVNYFLASLSFALINIFGSPSRIWLLESKSPVILCW